MLRQLTRAATLLAILLAALCGTISAQQTRTRKLPDLCDRQTGLNGLYRIDSERSDRLYSVIESAASNVPFADQQQFFIDLAVRLAPPDLLAIECRGSRISIASSRASRVEFSADGVARTLRAANGETNRSRIWFDRNGLVFSSSGGSGDNLNFNFTPIDGGQALRVTRQISSKELIDPVVIRTIYNKMSDVARWDIFDDAQIARQNDASVSKTTTVRAQNSPASNAQNRDADELRDALGQWINATNRRDIERQMSFYMNELQAFYLTRNVSISAVQNEKNRAFAAARSIDIRAAEPEIIFQNGGSEAVMRFRKIYSIETGTKSRRGEVVQELRWRKTARGWKIFSERDIKFIR